MSGIKGKSVDTSIVENRMRTAAVGETVTYDDLTKLLGRDVRTYCRSCLATARNTLVKESIFFDTVPGVGFIRLSNDEACKSTRHYVAKSRSAVRRGLRHIRNVPYAGLDPESKREHLAISTQLAMIDLFSTSKSEKRISGAVHDESPLAIGETLKLFGGGN